MCSKSLEGRVALVTGGARGIGKAICARLAKEGAAVVMVDIMPDVAEATAAEFRAQGYDAMAFGANVAKMEDAEATVKATVDKYGKLDILVNCAGITRDTLLMRMTEEDFDAVIAVNLKGTFNFIKAAIRPMMKNRYGKIVNISSIVGRAGNAGQVNYSASKAALIGAAKALAREVGRKGILVNVVAPGVIETDMTKDLPKEQFLPLIPLHRAGKTEEIAGVVSFLCGPDSTYIHGQVIAVNGGLVI